MEVALLGASGLDPQEGASTTELSEAELKRMVVTRTARTILLADASKWQKPSTVRFAAWADLHDWVTDAPPPRTAAAGWLDAGTKIHDARNP